MVSPGTASLVKYAANAFHALKVAYANEVAAVAPAFGADGDQVMALVREDRILNVSPAYLRPGYAFGGSCLPKDLRALNRVAEMAGAPTPLLASILESNAHILRRSVEWVMAHGAPAVALLGLSFKPGVDDLRESPLVDLAERLVGKGIALTIHDPDVDPAALHGANLEFARGHLTHLTMLLRPTLAEAIPRGALVLLGKPGVDPIALAEACADGTTVLDLAHALPRDLPRLRVRRLEDPPPAGLP